MKLSQRQAIMIVGGIALVIGILVLLYLNLRPQASSNTAVTLTVWGTEDANAIGTLVATYPYAKVSYTQVDPAHYQSKLLSALAAGTGPDVFEINDREVPKWKGVIAPMPAAYAQSFGPVQLAALFPDVVTQDFAMDNALYGLPLSVDTLVMVYNKDLFNSAGIAFAPKTWDDFDTDIAALRSVDTQGQIAQAAAAIGGSTASITNAPDILALLMLQSGTQMTDASNTRATFSSPNSGAPGPAAFNFYLQFANAASPYYTWNDGMGDALASFAAGKTAILFAYQADLAAIRAKAPFLNIGIAPVPQAKGAAVSVSYPSYPGFVAAKAGQVNTAWNFILYLTTGSANEKSYLAATGRPPALRADIQADMNDPNLSVFAAQALTAKSWYDADPAAVAGIFDTAIKNVLNGAEDSSRALSEAEVAVSQLMKSAQ